MTPSDGQTTAAEIFGKDEALDLKVLDEMDRERVRREARRRLNAEERGPIVLPTARTLRAAIASGTPKVEWRIAGWMPRDARVLLAAQFKAGKTTLRDGFIRSIVDGDPWLGINDVTPISGSVVLIDTEMSEAQGLMWLREQRIMHDDRVQVFFMRGKLQTLDWRDVEYRARWAALLKSIRAEVLAFDCLRPAFDAFGLDEHKEAGRYLTAIDTLMSDAGIREAFIVHHMGHSGERARGDSRLLDWPDVSWTLVRQSDQPSSQRFISAYGRDVHVPESALTFDSDTRRLYFEGGSRTDSKARPALEAVRLLLTQTPDLSVRAIQEAMKDCEYGRDQIRAAIKLGVKEGTIIEASGARGAKIHRLCDRAGPCGQRAAHGANECAAAYIEPHARTLTTNVAPIDSARTVETFHSP